MNKKLILSAKKVVRLFENQQAYKDKFTNRAGRELLTPEIYKKYLDGYSEKQKLIDEAIQELGEEIKNPDQNDRGSEI